MQINQNIWLIYRDKVFNGFKEDMFLKVKKISRETNLGNIYFHHLPRIVTLIIRLL